MADLTHDEFVNSVRDALTHLYDHVHLQSHPLAGHLDDAAGMDRVARAQRLRRLLLETLEQLSPAADSLGSSEAARSYSILSYRYIDGLNPEEIARALALSPRQVYRKLREGVEAVASLLWDRLGLDRRAVHTEPEPPDDTDRRSLAQRAVQQLGSHAHPEMLEIHTVLEGILKDLRRYCDGAGAEIVLLPPAAPLHVYADRTMLRQALINLLTNGLGQAGQRALLIVLAPARGWLQLTLRAPGEEGLRGGGQVRPAHEAIGCHVATQLVQMQGGSVRYSVGDPWWVEVALPLAGPRHILVIDDMPDITNLFQRFTTHYPVEVVGAESADQAFEVLKNITPALILLDVMVPQHDGWEILQTLKANPATAQIPVVICSILNEPGLAAALGADGYLRKPVNQEALLQELTRWLHLDPALAEAPR